MRIYPAPHNPPSQPMTVPLSDLLVQSVDEVVADVLGHGVRTAFYESLQRQRGLSREAVPRHLDEFQQFLNETFGKGGETLARCIMKRFSEKLGWSFGDMQHQDLSDYFTLARRVTKSTNEIIMTA